jgi:hypothetical protein
MPRLATFSDLPSIRRLNSTRVQPSWPSQLPEETSAHVFSKWPSPEFDLFVTDQEEITGFLLMKRQIVRGMTSDRESLIYDYFAPGETEEAQLFEAAAAAAKDHCSQFLTIQVTPQDDRGRNTLKAKGFELESHRISVPSGEPRIPENSPYAVRPTGEEDAFLIGVLNSTMLSHTLSAGRDYDLGELTVRSMGAIMGQAARSDSGCAGLALTLNDEMVGHLLLELTDRMGYIYDLALEREHWGGTAVRHIMRAGSRLLFERGIPLFVGDVSASNRRALVVAQRALGFKTDCERYGLRV